MWDKQGFERALRALLSAVYLAGYRDFRLTVRDGIVKLSTWDGKEGRTRTVTFPLGDVGPVHSAARRRGYKSRNY